VSFPASVFCLNHSYPRWSYWIFTRVGTYVQRGSKFCFVVLVIGTEILIKILHYCPISPCFQHIAALHKYYKYCKLFTAVGRHAALHTFTSARPAVYSMLSPQLKQDALRFEALCTNWYVNAAGKDWSDFQSCFSQYWVSGGHARLWFQVLRRLPNEAKTAERGTKGERILLWVPPRGPPTRIGERRGIHLQSST
jgi:hypothetical protein